eukprot:scaffold28956_cov69-Phaeocystis_antarctica.AAC.5
MQQAAHAVYHSDLFAAEGKLKKDAACAVAGAVAIRHRSNKHTANTDQPSCEHERSQNDCDSQHNHAK